LENAKACRTCGESKPLDDFYLDRGAKDGRRSTCIACDKARKRTPEVREQNHRYYHSEKGKAAERRYYHEGKGRETRKAYNDQPDVKEKRSERQPAYTAKYNRSEKGKAWWKAYRSSPESKKMRHDYNQRPDVKEHNREYHRLYFYAPQYRAWLKEHQQLPEIQKRRLEVARRNTRTRYSRKRLLPATLTHEEWGHTLDFFDHRCVYCGCDGPLVQEHIIPVSAGGPYSAENIVPACQSCNASKRDKPVEQWANIEAMERIHAYLVSLCAN
jgi:hypothetical protein